MRGLINLFLFSPPTPSYSNDMGSPPLYIINGTPCLWYPYREARLTLLFFHDNATDLGLQRNIAYQMSRATKCNVCAVEYPGYGIFAGTPNSVDAINASKRVALYLIEHFGNVVLVGRSIGTGISTQVAKQLQDTGNPIGGLVLISPFSSVSDMAESILGSTVARMLTHGVLDTQRALQKVDCPLLLLHGSEDFYIPLHHSERIMAHAMSATKRLHILQGDTHTKLNWNEIYSQLKKFLNDLEYSESEI
jgi:pimeloyl-ACP methyl ester carboxylesterase